MIKYLELFKTAITALLSNKARTILTMLGIVIGIMSVILILALSSGGKAKINQQFEELGTGVISMVTGKISDSVVSSDGFFDKPNILYEDAEYLREKVEIEGVEAVSGVITRNLSVSIDGVKPLSTTVIGVQEGYERMYNISMQIGDFITRDDEVSQSRVAVIGSGISQTLFGKGVNPVGQEITIDNKYFIVIGVAEPKSRSLLGDPNRNVYVPLGPNVKILFGLETVNEVSIGVKDPGLISSVKQEVTTIMFERRGILTEEDRNFTLLTIDQQLSSFNNILAAVSALLAGIAAISLIVGGIGIMNIMLVTVTERTREVGLLKAIGAKQSDILSQFLIEAILLTSISGIIGVSLGVAVDLVAAKLLNIPFGITPGVVLLAVGVSSIVGIVFGLYPARKAAKLNPIDALRFE
jgi:putative ABC transport system permease protein